MINCLLFLSPKTAIIIVINVDFSKNGKLQKRGKVNLIGRLQLSTERSKEEDNECIVQLRILRVQVSINFSKNIVFYN